MKLSGLPFQTQEDPEGWVAAFIRYYAYLVHVVDEHIARVLNALRDSGQEENTIVIFTADYGAWASRPVSESGSDYVIGNIVSRRSLKNPALLCNGRNGRVFRRLRARHTLQASPV
jgi:arylsulfatase A-like enzyme